MYRVQRGSLRPVQLVNGWKRQLKLICHCQLLETSYRHWSMGNPSTFLTGIPSSQDCYRTHWAATLRQSWYVLITVLFDVICVAAWEMVPWHCCLGDKKDIWNSFHFSATISSKQGKETPTFACTVRGLTPSSPWRWNAATNKESAHKQLFYGYLWFWPGLPRWAGTRKVKLGR